MPSIIDGLFAARSGIQSQGTGISVLADNISNANTTGFKYSRADFADLIAGNLSGGGAVAGSGSQVKAITPVITQGTFEFTGRGLDVGIDGSGYLIAQDANGSGQRFYTRAGNLKVDTDGNLLNQDGYQILGFPSSGAGGLQALNVNQRATNSVQSNSITIGGNLDASAATTSVPGTLTFNNLNNNASFSTFFDVFDSLGAKHTVTTYFFKTAANSWTANGYVDAGDVGGVAGSPSQVFTTPITFSATGALTAPLNGGPVAGSATWSNGAAASALSFNFNPFTQFSSPSNISSISQDGTGTGNVVGFQVEANGNVFAQLDNGQTASIGFLALANFANAEALRRVGGSVYAQTSAAGEPVVGRPQTGSFGGISPGSLELSNSDIAADFIKLISFQKAFQGSSRVITNINDLLNAIVQLA